MSTAELCRHLDRGRRPILDPQLPDDPLHMLFDGSAANPEDESDFFVRPAMRQQERHSGLHGW